MLIALLGEPYIKGYRGLYRKFPRAPKGKEALEYWTECLCLTQGFPIEYDLESFKKLYGLIPLLHKEKIPADLILVDRNIEIANTNTKLLGYDLTNETMYDSILGEESLFQKIIYNKWGVNQFKLLDSAPVADVLAEYMNRHAGDFEKDGKYRRVSIECVE